MQGTLKLSHLHLGFAPAMGKDAVGQSFHFKGLMRAEIGSVDGAWLEHVTGNGQVGMVVRYDPETKGAEDWAKRAVQWAPNIWARVEKQAERGRAG